MANKFGCEYLMYCLGTNILHSFSVLQKLNHIILFRHFYLFLSDLIDLLTPKGSHFLSKKHGVLHRRLNLGFLNFKLIFHRMQFFSVAIFFSACGYLCLHWYLHFKHFIILGFNISSFNILRWKYKSIKSYRASHLKPLTRKSETPITFPNF